MELYNNYKNLLIELGLEKEVCEFEVKNKIQKAITEKWRKIQGYKGAYEISNFGRIKSWKRKNETFITPWDNGKGYLHVKLTKDNKTNVHKVHRLVLETFYGIAPEGKEADHINKNRKDNRITNLRWATSSENSRNSKTNIQFIATSPNGVETKWGSGAEFIEAHPEINFNSSAISCCLKGKRKTHKGYTFELISKGGK